MNALLKIQTSLKVKKSKYNTFGRFHYRSCEDILEAVKPLLADVGACLTFAEEVFQLGDRFFIRSTAKLLTEQEYSSTEQEYSSTGVAGLSFDRISDSAQAAGAATSYARKYALCGLFLIDDGEDNDSIQPASAAPAAPDVPAAVKPLPPPPGGIKK